MNNQKIFASDIDDVLLKLIPHCLDKYNLNWNDNLKEEDITDWAISSFVKPECGEKFFNYFSPEIYDDIDVVENSLWGINCLRTLGYRVVFLTSNAFSVGNIKLNALNIRGFNIDEKDYFETSDKSIDGSPIKYDWLLDDNMDNILSAQEKGILFTRAWNKKYDYQPRVNEWIELIENLENITNRILV